MSDFNTSLFMLTDLTFCIFCYMYVISGRFPCQMYILWDTPPSQQQLQMKIYPGIPKPKNCKPPGPLASWVGECILTLLQSVDPLGHFPWQFSKPIRFGFLAMKSLWFFHDHALFDRAAPLFSGSVTLNTRRGNEKRRRRAHCPRTRTRLRGWNLGQM